MNILKDIIKKENLYYTSNTLPLFVYERVEKITTAIYLVTGFLSDKEPLKFILRERGVNLMLYIMSFRTKQMSFREEPFLVIDLLIQEINSSLKIALLAKLISEMNYSVLNLEFKKVLNLIKEGGENSYGEKEVLLENFFEQAEKKDFAIQGNYKNVLYKGHSYKGQNQTKGQLVTNKKTSLGENITPNFSKKTSSKLVAKVSKSKAVLNNIKKERRDKIIKIIKDTKEVTIKDIIKKIRDCSEKTIQRDLVSMLSEGVLKKEGERRWSRYLLK